MDIREARKALNLTQAELAEKLGVSGGTVSRFESGDLVPSTRTVLAMEAILARSEKAA